MADIQTVITGNVQQAQNILNNLLNQTWQYASSLQSDNLQFFNQAQNVLNNFPNIIEQLYNQTIYGIPANLPNLNNNGDLTNVFNAIQNMTGIIVNPNWPAPFNQPFINNTGNTQSSLLSGLDTNPIGTTLPNGLSSLEALDSGNTQSGNLNNNYYGGWIGDSPPPMSSLFITNPSLQPHTGGLTIRPVFPVPISETSGVAQPNSIEGNFANTESTVANLYNALANTVAQNYNSLYQNVEQQMQNQWAKSSDVLSALGMYNSPATQQTQADITTNLYGKVAQEETNALNQVASQKTQALTGLNISNMNTLDQLAQSELETLTNYYQNLPKQEQMLAGWNVQMDPTLTNFGLQMQIAQALNGLNVGVLPQQSELSQFAQEAPGIIGAIGGLMQLGTGLLGLATGNPVGAFMGFTGGISPWLNMAGNALGSLWSGIENVGGSILSGIGSVASDIASGIGDVVSGIGDAIGSLFG